ncbi:MAG: NUDIX hydrolase [Aestuariivirga sp.]|uniref:NUDIX hydrolase n=1 Tax=Aestuariivirga sp. TaxID=2650926 RepID=UPI00301A3F1A
MIRAEIVTALDLRCTGRPWAFEAANRAAIARHWDAMVAAKPTLWNGRTLICTSATVEHGVFRAELSEIDYASFVAWRDWGRPDQSVVNCFGVPAVFASDGALLIGVMSPTTLNAGMAYPPSGSLEPKDVRPDGTVDILGNMRIELLEETGLDLAEATPGPMMVIFEGPRLAVVQRFDVPLSFAEIERHFAAHAAQDAHAELSAVEPLRNASQVDPRMPGYVAQLLRHFA